MDVFGGVLVFRLIAVDGYVGVNKWIMKRGLDEEVE